MPFSPIPELLDEIRAGRMVVIVDDEDRENEGDLIMAAELVRPSDVNFMVTHARGLVCLSLTRERCRQLGLPPMVRDNTSKHHTNFTVSIEAAEGVTTGISAYDRAHTIRTAVRPDAKPSDLSQPGHIFPLMSQPGGVLSRAGHTEAATDLAMLAGLEPAGVLVEVLNPDGSMARRPQLEAFAREHGLKIGSIEELIRYRLSTEHTVERVDEREIETEHGPFRLVAYRDRLSHALHFALLRGRIDAAAPTLVRVQTLNPLADALHWRRADFGPAVGDVLAAIAREGRGVLVLLADAADPDALLARLRAPQHEAEAAPARGHALAEWRRTGAGGQILADLGLGKLRVLGTPRKQIGLAGFGLEVVEYLEPPH
ncbi:3,4-dihydroxy-2-butanone-4-phosphate synthase [Vulcaniibacterium tengchongense]|uniref:3,4-dihydroxy-2-butanone 4-phosphate synthase n=1 Tax=Vulcaniibacterium tengchongense TaxID=1273429 RepID=A0A3N4VJN5_9GAMM|nr:3,4-dihydroxy-2-butanone-4-phosphate synthase [Vulcaniibacterium tengchongense]RPE79541.1 GTP cyclohydrolase II /3,4-dihydroxy-2-butanone 4-phosphate synthase [Vulcaniibacterium tengchongense]